jgi:uncharacterized protein (TIGR00645 family)
VGLVLAIFLLLYVFASEVLHFISILPAMKTNDAILAVLSLIDLSLAANLLIIVIFSGYENFVSKFNIADHVDRPDWHGKVTFATLKLKLIGSIVAISSIHLLKVFMSVEKYDTDYIMWMVIIHCVFFLSAIAMAVSDKIGGK